MIPAHSVPLRRPATQQTPFEVVVLFTGMRQTAVALRKARELTAEIGAQILVLAPYVVPYPLPLYRPSVSSDFLRKRFELLIGDEARDTRVMIGLCRDRERFLEDTLPAASTVVMRIEKRWMFSDSGRLARRLSALGHNVVLV